MGLGQPCVSGNRARLGQPGVGQSCASGNRPSRATARVSGNPGHRAFRAIRVTVRLGQPCVPGNRARLGQSGSPRVPGNPGHRASRATVRPGQPCVPGNRVRLGQPCVWATARVSGNRASRATARASGNRGHRASRASARLGARRAPQSTARVSGHRTPQATARLEPPRVSGPSSKGQELTSRRRFTRVSGTGLYDWLAPNSGDNRRRPSRPPATHRRRAWPSPSNRRSRIRVPGAGAHTAGPRTEMALARTHFENALWSRSVSTSRAQSNL